MPLVKEHLTKAQQAQQRHYNRPAQPREFHPGDRVMVLPGRRRAEQLYHINLLKRWVGTREQLAAIAKAEPAVVVPKPDGTLRFCNDFRKLNEVSEFDGYPMPRVDELLDRLGRARFITTLDLTKGYWQVPLAEDAKPKTAFTTPSGHWQYKFLPFGLHGAPATFQRLMDIVLRPHQSYAAAYIDDVVIHSEHWDEHLSHLRRVLTELWRSSLTANPRKCHLTLSEAKYLGYQVGRGLIKPQPKKVEAVQAAPRPSTKTQVRAFLGLVGYYRCFIPNFSSIASPLTDLTRKGQPEKIEWSPKAERAFQQVKKALTSEPVLRALDFSHPFLVQTDASDTGLRLGSPVPGNRRRRTPCDIHQPEADQTRAKLRGSEEGSLSRQVGSPGAALLPPGKKDFHFDVQHRSGVSNANADGLSRIWTRTMLGGGSVTSVPIACQRRLGNRCTAPADHHHGPIGHGCSQSRPGYISSRAARSPVGPHLELTPPRTELNPEDAGLPTLCTALFSSLHDIE
ncbi:Retrovirus-related Pol polyprotein from transposon 17.6 [Labeo rohita]|uniref:ribonuclease H n=1 Tax=Labeo rohita TaxID=84645 RepID=A0ABQ8LUV0_LABRO|nr:Retrovirus-related Pol polyprotein from transposon 17.6 [Labeo rohita]